MDRRIDNCNSHFTNCKPPPEYASQPKLTSAPLERIFQAFFPSPIPGKQPSVKSTQKTQAVSRSDRPPTAFCINTDQGAPATAASPLPPPPPPLARQESSRDRRLLHLLLEAAATVSPMASPVPTPTSEDPSPAPVAAAADADEPNNEDPAGGQNEEAGNDGGITDHNHNNNVSNNNDSPAPKSKADRFNTAEDRSALRAGAAVILRRIRERIEEAADELRQHLTRPEMLWILEEPPIGCIEHFHPDEPVPGCVPCAGAAAINGEQAGIRQQARSLFLASATLSRDTWMVLAPQMRVGRAANWIAMMDIERWCWKTGEQAEGAGDPGWFEPMPIPMPMPAQAQAQAQAPAPASVPAPVPARVPPPREQEMQTYTDLYEPENEEANLRRLGINPEQVNQINQTNEGASFDTLGLDDAILGQRDGLQPGAQVPVLGVDGFAASPLYPHPHGVTGWNNGWFGPDGQPYVPYPYPRTREEAEAAARYYAALEVALQDQFRNFPNVAAQQQQQQQQQLGSPFFQEAAPSRPTEYPAGQLPMAAPPALETEQPFLDHEQLPLPDIAHLPPIPPRPTWPVLPVSPESEVDPDALLPSDEVESSSSGMALHQVVSSIGHPIIRIPGRFPPDVGPGDILPDLDDVGSLVDLIPDEDQPGEENRPAERVNADDLSELHRLFRTGMATYRINPDPDEKCLRPILNAEQRQQINGAIAAHQRDLRNRYIEQNQTRQIVFLGRNYFSFVQRRRWSVTRNLVDTYNTRRQPGRWPANIGPSISNDLHSLRLQEDSIQQRREYELYQLEHDRFMSQQELLPLLPYSLPAQTSPAPEGEYEYEDDDYDDEADDEEESDVEGQEEPEKPIDTHVYYREIIFASVPVNHPENEQLIQWTFTPATMREVRYQFQPRGSQDPPRTASFPQPADGWTGSTGVVPELANFVDFPVGLYPDGSAGGVALPDYLPEQAGIGYPFGPDTTDLLEAGAGGGGDGRAVSAPVLNNAGDAHGLEEGGAQTHKRNLSATSFQRQLSMAKRERLGEDEQR